MSRNRAVSLELLTAALAGLEQQKSRIEQQISDVRALLGGGAKRPGRRPKKAGASTRGKRRLSPEGRARIAEAARKRWAAKRKAAAE